MEVFVGPTFTIDVPSSPPPSDQTDGRLFLNEVSEEVVPAGFRISGPSKFFTGGSPEPESSSSIGTPDDSDNDEEVQSELNLKGRNGLVSLDSLEDSLPIKRGLSSHFEGKSKSFTDLSQVNNLKELQKQESPFNKRRRVLIASKFTRKSAFYSWSNPQSMPLLPVNEVNDNDDDYCYDYEDNEEEGKARKLPSTSSSSSSSNSLVEDKKQEDDQVQIRHGRFPESYAAEIRLRSFKSRSFSLADLQEHDDEEDDEDD